MKIDYSYRHIWTITYPILVSLVMEQLINLTDTAFMGRVGEVELGASAIAGVFYLVVFMVGHGFCIGAQIVMARRNGSGSLRSIGSIFYQGLYFLMATAALLFAVCQLWSSDVLSLLISSPHVLGAAEDYMRWRVYGFFFAFAGGMFRSFYVATTRTKTLTLNSVVMVLSNVVFNYVLVFGKCGLPAMGIGGAAIGSSLAELVSLLFFIGYTRWHVDFRRYALGVVPAVDFATLRSVLGVSVWVMVQSFVSLSTWFIFFVYIEHLGEEPLAVTNIVRSLSGFLFMIVMAFASACSSVVSNMIGAGQTGQVGAAIRRHVWLTYACVMPLVAVLALWPRVFIAIYTDIPQLAAAAVPSVWVMCLSYFVTVPSNILFQSVSGTGSTRVAFGLELLTLVFYMAYITLVIYYMRADVAWAWTSEILYGAMTLVLCYAYLHRGTWRRRRI